MRLTCSRCAPTAPSSPRETGTITEGITRFSVIRLLEEQDLAAFEKNITVDEVVAGVRDGSITEVIACGTAAAVTPVERMASNGFDFTIRDGDAGAVRMGVRKTLADMRYGHAADLYGWMKRLG